MLTEAWSELQSPPAPAAGGALTLLVPGHTHQRWKSVRFTVVTSAAVANRVPFVAFTNGDGVEYYRVTGGAPITAGLTVTCTFAQELDTNPQVAAGFIDGPLREETLPAGYHLVLGVTAIDGADQISGVEVWVHRYPTGPMMPAVGALTWPASEI